MDNKNRRGIIMLSDELQDALGLEGVDNLLKDVVVAERYHHPIEGYVKIWATSKHFDEVPEVTAAPVYTGEVAADGTVRWTRR